MKNTQNTAGTSYNWTSSDHSLFFIPKTCVMKGVRWVSLVECCTGPAKMVLMPSYWDSTLTSGWKAPFRRKYSPLALSLSLRPRAFRRIGMWDGCHSIVGLLPLQNQTKQLVLRPCGRELPNHVSMYWDHDAAHHISWRWTELGDWVQSHRPMKIATSQSCPWWSLKSLVGFRKHFEYPVLYCHSNTR